MKHLSEINNLKRYVGCSFKVGVEESIVNAPFVRLQSKNTNNAKVRLDLNS
jgi:hypothetical protein